MKKGKYFEQTIISRLEKENEKLRATIKDLESMIKGLKAIIKEKDKRIKELEDKLEDKELQRKQLFSYLYKANRGNREGKKLGKKEGAKEYQRPKPRGEEVTGISSRSCARDLEQCVWRFLRFSSSGNLQASIR
jgi:septal ring factor EnvC (AmiA/AmiB activator)